MVRDARRAYADETLDSSERRSGKSPASEPVPRVEDWRTPAERTADAARTGTWWRCRTHGPTQNPVLVGTVVYCAEPDCTAQLLLARSAARDGIGDFQKPREVFGTETYHPRAPRPKHSKDSAERSHAGASPARSEAVATAPAIAAQPEPVPRPAPAPPPVGTGEHRYSQVPMAEREAHVTAQRGDNVQIVIDALKQLGSPCSGPALLHAFSKARPDLGDRAAQNFNGTMQRLRKQGRVSRSDRGWSLVLDPPTRGTQTRQKRGRERSGNAPDRATDVRATGAAARDSVQLSQGLAERIDALVALGLWESRDEAVEHLLHRVLEKLRDAMGAAAA